MEKLKDIKKVIFPIVVLIIMIGAIVVATVGFNFSLMYQSHKRIEIYIDKEYSAEEVTEIVKEMLPEQKIIEQNVETFNKDKAFIVKNISEEQIKALEEKINEKYELEEESVIVISEPHTKMSDIMKPYVKPLIVTSIIILIYLIIRFRKVGVLNVGLLTIASIIILQALYYSVLAICRIPVSRLTMPVSLLVYILTVSAITLRVEKISKESN